MEYPLFESLVRQVRYPRIFRLNYSGESTVYPELIPAIRLARSAGAFVELVSALGAAPESMLTELSESGLNRLTVSVHAASDPAFTRIYRYISFDAFRTRLVRFKQVSCARPNAPILDFAFVAMDRNLDELCAAPVSPLPVNCETLSTGL